jgi:WD40 repeat protein
MPLSNSYTLGLDDDEEEPRRFLSLPCGSLLAYGGDDGNVCVRTSTDEFSIVQRYDDAVRAVAVSQDGKRIAVGFDNGGTQIYDYDDYTTGTTSTVDEPHPFCQTTSSTKSDDLLSQDFTSTATNFFAGPQCEGPIRDLQFVDKGTDDDKEYWLAIASESGLVVVNVTCSDTLSQRELEHEAKEHHDHCGIRGVAVHGNVLASLAMDGRVCVWNLVTLKLVHRESTWCIPKKDVGEVHGSDAYDRSCRPVISKDCLLLATPGQLLPVARTLNGTEITTLDLTNTQEDDPGHVESIVCLAFLPNHHLVTSGRDSRLILWKREETKLTPIETVQLGSPATDLYIHKDNTTHQVKVSAACAKGACAVVDFSEHFMSKQTKKKDTTTSTEAEASTKSHKKKMKPTPAAIEDDNDSDIDFGGDDSQQPKNRVRFVDDEAAEDDDDNDDKVEQAAKRQEANPTDAGDDFKDDNGDDMLVHNDMDDMDNDDDSMIEAPHRFFATQALVKPQPAFSPSSTPLDLARRFLCWNHIGAITLLQGDDLNTVDISFTDSAYKRPISFTDNMHFIVGSLGEDGGIFASDLQHEDDDDMAPVEGLDDMNMSERTKQAVKRSHKKGGKPTGSSIYFYRFETFGKFLDKDWYLTLPDGERVLGTASGGGWAAVVTSRNFLRFFSSGGNQGQVTWLKGDPVTMAGRGRFMAVFYHLGSPLSNGSQKLGYTLWDAANFQVLSHGSVSCLSKGASLTWVGFSNDCSLMAMDSDGMMSMLVQAGSDGHWEWVPVLDTIGLRKSADDQFWPVTVCDGKLVCVPLKGGNTYPDAARRPVTDTLGMRLPLAPSSIAKT